MRKMLGQILPPILVLLAAALSLEAYVRIFHVPKYKMPLPSAVLSTLIDNRMDLLQSLWTTTQAALIGFAASIVVGILLAILLAGSRWVRRALYPYTVFFQTVPIVAIAPLLLMWFDAGLVSVSISAFIVSVFPVIANTLAGLLATDPALVDLFKLYNAHPFDRLWKLRLPYALPSIVTGLRISAGLAVIGTIVSEFMVGTLVEGEGLGVRIVGAIKYGHMEMAFAAVFIASMLGLAMVAMVNLAGYLMLRRWM